MGHCGDTAKGAFDALFPLEIGRTRSLGASESFCSQIISSMRGDGEKLPFMVSAPLFLREAG